jgi:hypothetical protein
MERDEAVKVWESVLSDLEGTMARQTFDNLLLGSQVQSCGNGQWTVAVRNAYAVDWLENRLASKIGSVMARHVKDKPKLVFVPATYKERKAETESQAKPARAKQPQAERQSQVPTRKPKAHGTDEPILEAVREQRTAVDCNGKSLQYTEFYIRLKVAFRDRALRLLRGSKLSVFLCLALHVDAGAVSSPGIEQIMEQTGYSRQSVCTALADLVEMGFVEKLARRHHRSDRYEVKGYAWYGRNPAAALLEETEQT